MQIIEKKQCSGCTACYNKCPNNAISMQFDDDGFLYPVIDESKCTKCGLCQKICPAINPEIRCNKQQFKKPDTFAAYNADEKIRLNSASGGMFSVFADWVLEQNGYICATAFDNNFKQLRHIITNDKKDLDKLRSSKYVQSELGDNFKKIEELLKQDNHFLFVGTPCQVAGLNAFLGQNYEKLLTIDLLCSCVNPPKLLDEYIKYVTQNENSQIEAVNFRDKILGWSNFSFSLKYKENNNTKVFCKCHRENDNIFFQGFLSKLWMRPCCSGCIYGNKNRNSDITLGDAWGISEKYPELDYNLGLSTVLLNNEKAKNLFENLRDKLGLCKPLDRNFTLETQPILRGEPYSAHSNRKKFFKYLPKTDSPMELTKDLLGINKIGILTFQFSKNYGAQLQAYGLSQTIKKLGFYPKIIDWSIFNPHKYIESNVFNDFQEKYLNMSAKCFTTLELLNATKDCTKFIAGGDQVWRYWEWTNEEDIFTLERYFMDFVSGDKTIISYAPSFGKDIFEGPKDVIERGSELLKRFDAISVREDSGVELLKNVFGVDGIKVLDPSLLLDAQEYEQIIENEEIKTIDKKYIAYMYLEDKWGLGELPNTEQFKNLSEKYDAQIINVNADPNDNTQYASVAQWLYYIKNCECIITDSFHAIAFAIIFKKPFIAVKRDFGGNSRIENLLAMLKINKPLLNSLDEVDESQLEETIDFEKAHEILKTEQKKSIEFLLENLLKTPKNKPEYYNKKVESKRFNFEINWLNKKLKINKNIIKSNHGITN